MSHRARRLQRNYMLMTCIGIIAILSMPSISSAGDFIDVMGMKRHAVGGPPSIPSPMTLLLANPAMQFRHDAQLPKTTGVEGDVAKANRKIKVMSGYTGDGNVKTVGAQVKVMAPGIVVLAGARYDEADDYKDANGNDVRFGYKRDTEQIMLQWMPNPGGKLRLIGVRDVIKDDLQDHHTPGMDVANTERLVGKAIYTQKLNGDVFKGFGLELVSKNVEREPDNYNNRMPPNPMMKLRAKTERHIVEGKASAKLNLIGWATNVALSGGWDNHNARRYNDSVNAVNAIKLPDITRTMFGFALDGTRAFDGGVKLQAGVRYDLIHADPADAAVNGTVPGGAGVPWNWSPAQLYNTYYGLTGDYERTDHNISARLRISKSMMAKRFEVFGDFSRKVRSPDNIEAYHAMTHPMAGNRWIGNPGLDPEAHHKAELGFIWKGANYKGYGKLGPDADGPMSLDNMQIKLSGYVDAVDNFIAFDRARGQNGILLADGALIHRNVDALFAGANFEARWNLTNNWSTAVQASYLWGNNESDNRALYQIAPMEANFLLDYRDTLGSVGTWNVGGKLRLVSDQNRVDDVAATGLGMDNGKGKGFATVDIYGGMQISNRWSLSAGVNNLFDVDYQEHLTGSHIAAATKTKLNAPGRTFFVRSMLNF